MNFGSLFSGGELAGVGARAAGLRHVWGIEHDDAIASVARANGFNVHTADVLAVDPHSLPPVDVLHASPPCPNFSVAKSGAAETALDRALGEKVAQFVDVLAPRVFTLENVYGYRDSAAFGAITAALTRNGYLWDYSHENSADYGVPQTRRRLILRAGRGALLPHLPLPVPWVGWYSAIEDLIPSLPASRFAPWQLARLPAELGETVLVNNHYGDPGGNIWNERKVGEPAHVVTALNPMRAFIVSNAATEYSDGMRWQEEPALAVTGQSGGRVRAWLVDGLGNTSRDVTILPRDAPSMTVQAWHGRRPAHAPRAWLASGRVVSMTPRALARFQSAPDSYVLPDKNGLACRIIGNGCPPLEMEAIYRQLTGALS